MIEAHDLNECSQEGGNRYDEETCNFMLAGYGYIMLPYRLVKFLPGLLFMNPGKR